MKQLDSYSVVDVIPDSFPIKPCVGVGSCNLFVVNLRNDGPHSPLFRNYGTNSFNWVPITTLLAACRSYLKPDFGTIVVLCDHFLIDFVGTELGTQPNPCFIHHTYYLSQFKPRKDNRASWHTQALFVAVLLNAFMPQHPFLVGKFVTLLFSHYTNPGTTSSCCGSSFSSTDRDDRR